MKTYDRKFWKYIDYNITGDFLIKLLYRDNVVIWFFQKIFVKKFLTNIAWKIADMKVSRKLIKWFVKKNCVDMSEYPEDFYKTFNEFFYRKINLKNRPLAQDPAAIISPADGCVLGFTDIWKNKLFIKNDYFDLHQLLLDKELYEEFENCSCVIIRLTPRDYHRFHFPIDWNILLERNIEWKYYSVSKYAFIKKANILSQNKRFLTLINNEKMWNVVFIQVWATFVWSIIHNHLQTQNVLKWNEYWYFKFWWSSIVLLFRKWTVSISKDILENTQNWIETYLRMGEEIARVV